MGQTQTNHIQYSVPVSEKTVGGTEIRRQPNCVGKMLATSYSEDIKTLQDIWIKMHKAYSNNVFLASRDKITNNYMTKSYSQINTIAEELGSGVQHLNLAQRIQSYQNFDLQMVGIYAPNREEWLYVDIGCGIMQGMTIVPMYDTFGPENLTYCLNHSEMSVIFANSASIDNLLKIEDIGKLQNIISFDEVTQIQREQALARNLKIYDMKEIREMGKQNPQPYAKITPDTIFTFSYTSGTTGTPKAAMISHQNITSIIAVLKNNKDLNLDHQDVHLSYLPLPHLLERCVCLAIVSYGASIYFFNGDMLKLKQDLADVRPTIFVSVPRLYNKMYSGIMSQINNASQCKRSLGNMAINAKLNNLRQNKILTHSLWDKLVFNKISQGLFGGRIKVLVTGSAPLSKEVIEFFQIACSCPMLEGYGQTECCGAVFITDGQDLEIGHVGGPQVNCEFKLEDIPEMNYLSTDKDESGILFPRGEICVKGPSVFRGYYKDLEKTNEAIDKEGWLHTGDVGQLNVKTGSITIIDRKKNIFKLSQGEYVAPEKVEISYLKTSVIAEAFVYGDSLESYTIAIVVPEKSELEILAKEENLATLTFEELCQNIKIRYRVLQKLQEQGKKDNLIGFEQIKNVFLEPVSFSLQGCTTNTMKIQRHQMKLKFSTQIKQLYKEGQLLQVVKFNV